MKGTSMSSGACTNVTDVPENQQGDAGPLVGEELVTAWPPGWMASVLGDDVAARVADAVAVLDEEGVYARGWCAAFCRFGAPVPTRALAWRMIKAVAHTSEESLLVELVQGVARATNDDPPPAAVDLLGILASHEAVPHEWITLARFWAWEPRSEAAEYSSDAKVVAAGAFRHVPDIAGAVLEAIAASDKVNPRLTSHDELSGQILVSALERGVVGRGTLTDTLVAQTTDAPDIILRSDVATRGVRALIVGGWAPPCEWADEILLACEADADLVADEWLRALSLASVLDGGGPAFVADRILKAIATLSPSVVAQRLRRCRARLFGRDDLDRAREGLTRIAGAILRSGEWSTEVWAGAFGSHAMAMRVLPNLLESALFYAICRDGDAEEERLLAIEALGDLPHTIDGARLLASCWGDHSRRTAQAAIRKNAFLVAAGVSVEDALTIAVARSRGKFQRATR